MLNAVTTRSVSSGDSGFWCTVRGAKNAASAGSWARGTPSLLAPWRRMALPASTSDASRVMGLRGVNCFLGVAVAAGAGAAAAVAAGAAASSSASASGATAMAGKERKRGEGG